MPAAKVAKGTVPVAWVGQGVGGSLRNFDEIIVTAEPQPGASSPTGPVVLGGSLVSC